MHGAPKQEISGCRQEAWGTKGVIFFSSRLSLDGKCGKDGGNDEDDEDNEDGEDGCIDLLVREKPA